MLEEVISQLKVTARDIAGVVDSLAKEVDAITIVVENDGVREIQMIFSILERLYMQGKAIDMAIQATTEPRLVLALAIMDKTEAVQEFARELQATNKKIDGLLQKLQDKLVQIEVIHLSSLERPQQIH